MNNLGIFQRGASHTGVLEVRWRPQGNVADEEESVASVVICRGDTNKVIVENVAAALKASWWPG